MDRKQTEETSDRNRQEVDPETQAKADRTIWIINGVMILFIGAPFVVWYFIR